MKKLIFLLAQVSLAISAGAQDTTFYQNIEWSPGGKSICTEAITRDGGNLHFSSWIIVPGDNTVKGTIANSVFPAWRPGGKFIAYSKLTGVKNGADIWMTNLLTGDTLPVTNTTYRNSGVSFSPDGSRICFSSNRDVKQNVYVMNVDGTGLKRITTDTFSYFNPVWSPAGNKIVYFREKGDGHDKVMMADLDAGTEMLITKDTMHDIYPAFLPNGDAIIYTECDPASSMQKEKRIVQVSLNGDDKKYFPVALDAFWARVSPDGKKIAFIKGGWPANNIYLADTDGKSPSCITCNLKVEK